MLLSLLRHSLWTAVLLLILTLLSYGILLKDPINAEFMLPHVYANYFHYLSGLLQGDAGISYRTGELLSTQILTVLPPTLELCFTALLLAFIIGVPLGILSAVNNQRVFADVIQSTANLGVAVPVFWLAPILLYFSAVYGWEISALGQYHLLYEIKPVTGFPLIDVWFTEVPYRIKIVQSVLQHIVLPTLILSILPMMEIIRLIHQRAEFILTRQYSKVAVTRGWSKWKILRRYVFRNTFPLLIPQVTRVFTLVLTQCMLVETTLGWPGIGRWLMDAVAQQDYNSIAAGVVVIGTCIIIIDNLAKLAVFFLDPLNKKGWYAG